MKYALITLLATTLAGCLDPIYGESLDTSAADTVGTNYPTEVTAAFTNNSCTNAGCHGGGSASGGVNLEDGSCDATVAAVVTVNDSAGSVLYIEVEDGTMPIGADPLTDDELADIAAWIDGGAACE